MKKYTFSSFLLFLFFFGLLFYNHALALEVEYPRLGSSPGLSADTELPQYVKYIFDFGMGIGILIVIASLAIGGVFYVLSSANPKWKAWAMDRISGAITGFFVLLFTYLIITTINPELSIFRFNFKPNSTPLPPTPTEILSPGVYLYPVPDCDAKNPSLEATPTPYTASISNLGKLGDTLRSGKIVQDPKNDRYYAMFFHDRFNFQGSCEQIDPNTPCTNVDTPKASSMSIYQYNMKDDGTGVILYRKPYFKEQGGWVKLSAKDFKLETLTFNGNGGGCTVPEEEQDCIKWNINGQCAKNSRRCPKLTPENINSIKTGGKYIVLFYYAGRVLSGNNPYKWSNCQIFPTPEDVNFTGPKIMKWDYIRNYGDIPNTISIFPVIR